MDSVASGGSVVVMVCDECHAVVCHVCGSGLSALRCS